MENRFEQNPPEEQQGWGAYATPPPISGQFNKENTNLPPQLSLCARVRDILPHLVENDGDIRPEMAREVYGHLSICSGCAKELDEMQRVVVTLESLPPAEMPMDFSQLIMQRIERPNAPAISREDYRERISALQNTVPFSTEPKAREIRSRIDAPTVTSNVTRSTSRHQVGVTSSRNLQVNSAVGVIQRVIASAVLTAVLVVLVSTSWGRELLGQNVAAARIWLNEISEAVKEVPMLGSLTTYIVGALTQNVKMIEETYRTLGDTAVQGLILDAGLCAAAYYFLAARKSRGPARRI